LDIFLTKGAAVPSLEKSDPSYANRLFRNNRDGTFTDATEKAGLQGIGYAT
jgi:enediyne biosynthesis protein E4